ESIRVFLEGFHGQDEDVFSTEQLLVIANGSIVLQEVWSQDRCKAQSLIPSPNEHIDWKGAEVPQVLAIHRNGNSLLFADTDQDCSSGKDRMQRVGGISSRILTLQRLANECLVRDDGYSCASCTALQALLEQASGIGCIVGKRVDSDKRRYGAGTAVVVVPRV